MSPMRGVILAAESPFADTELEEKEPSKIPGTVLGLLVGFTPFALFLLAIELLLFDPTLLFCGGVMLVGIGAIVAFATGRRAFATGLSIAFILTVLLTFALVFLFFWAIGNITVW